MEPIFAPTQTGFDALCLSDAPLPNVAPGEKGCHIYHKFSDTIMIPINALSITIILSHIQHYFTCLGKFR